MSRYVIVLLMFILGLSSGFASSYAIFYPQINSLNASIDTLVKLQIDQDDVIQSLELNDNLLNEEINSLKLNNSRLLIQLNETQTFQPDNQTLSNHKLNVCCAWLLAAGVPKLRRGRLHVADPAGEEDGHPRRSIGGVPGPRPVHDGVQVERQIEGCENGAGNESDIQRPCHATSGWEGATLRWKEEKGQNLNESEMECPLVEESEWADAGYVELEKRERDRQNDEGPCGKVREPQIPPPNRGPASRSHKPLSTDVDIGTPHREEIRRSGTSYPASTK